MRKVNKWNIYLLSLCIGLFLTSNSFAEPHGDTSHGKKMHSSHQQDMGAGHGDKHGGKHGGKHGKKSGKGGTFSPHWAKTLTDEQKISFDKMHLMVGQYEAVHRAKMKMLKAELRVLVATDSKNQKAIYAKIDEILAVKKGVMRSRFDHIAEMRAELTEQQRISYDMGLLKKGKHKH